MATPPDLLGVGVLITRPERQAGSLRRLIEAHGGTAFLLPAVEIKPHPERRTLLMGVRDIGSFDLIVFVSANAVRFGADLLAQRRDLEIAAIGPATARALNLSGYRVSVTPGRGFDSASLLEQLHSGRLRGQRVLIVKGSGGRDALELGLRARGAEVDIAEVYIRSAAQPTRASLDALDEVLRENRVQVVTAGSLELGTNLLAMVPASIQAGLKKLQWVVPSERVAAGIRNLGVHGEVETADSAEDHDMLRALLRRRSSVSGA